jgi:hypothetical protein
MPMRVLLIHRDIRCLDSDLSTVRHGIASIHHQVYEHLPELSRIYSNLLDLRHRQQLQFNVFADDALEHFANVEDQGVDVYGLWLNDLFTGKRQQLSGESGGTF